MMKKIISLVCLSLTLSSVAVADKKYDVVRNQTINCHADTVYDALLFCDWPQTRRCYKVNIFGHSNWTDCRDTFCSGGYSREGFDAETMEHEARNTGKNSKTSCWAWKCKPGRYTLGAQCVTKDKCEETPGFMVSGTNCVTSNWCDDTWKQGFVPTMHKQKFDTPGCSGKATFECLNGGCFRSTSDRTCVAVDEVGTFGGTAKEAGTSLCKKCGDMEFVSTTGCVAGGGRATKVQMRECFRCSDDAENFRQCIVTGSTSHCGDTSNSTNAGKCTSINAVIDSSCPNGAHPGTNQSDRDGAPANALKGCVSNGCACPAGWKSATNPWECVRS